MNSAPLNRGDRKNVSVDRLAVGGKGVARIENLVVFVTDSAPGDELEIELTLVKKNFAEGRIIRVLKPGGSRRTPPCPVAGLCGGCNWQHLDYPEQLRSKRELVRESLAKFSGFKEFEVSPVIPSPDELRYRNRIQLHHARNGIGFFKRGSHEIVDIDDCPITDERLTALIPQMRDEFARTKPGRVEIYLDQNNQTARRGGNFESSDGAGPAFSQVNTKQNENLIQLVTDLARQTSPREIFDLYAGSGNFTFPLARALQGIQITAVELNAESVRIGRGRARDLKEIQFVEASVDDFVQNRPPGPGTLVVLDPPRAGCGLDVMTNLARRNPSRILYVSCHPATLARDLQPLSAKGYRIECVTPFDMFPQTDHVETVVSLVGPS